MLVELILLVKKKHRTKICAVLSDDCLLNRRLPDNQFSVLYAVPVQPFGGNNI